MWSFLRATAFGVLIGVGGLSASCLPFVQHLEEDLGLGLLFKLRGIRAAPRDVVVVSIDRDSAEQLNLSGNPSRWPRTIHARLVEQLARAGAQVVTFDVYFTEPRSVDEDWRFAEAVRKAGNVVLAEPLRARDIAAVSSREASLIDHRIVKAVKPIAELSEAALASAPFVLPRLPIRVSQYWTFQTSAGGAPTFPVVAFQLYALPAYAEFVRLVKKVSPEYAQSLPSDGTNSSGTVSRIRQIRAVFEREPDIARKMIDELESSGLAAENVGKYRLLKSLIRLYGGANHRYLNFYGPPRTLATLPYHQVLRLGHDPSPALQPSLQGKAVFVGLSEILLTEKEDSFYTVFPNPNGVFISGVEIAATAFANLLEDAPVRPIDEGFALWLLLAWGLLIGMVCRMARAGAAALALLCFSAFYLYGATHQFTAGGIWYPILVPLFLQNTSGFLGATFWNYYEVRRERQNIRNALGFYVPTDVVHQLANDILDLKKGDQTVYGVCLFTDAAGYTTVSEAMGAGELGEYMGKYFDAAFEPIKHNGGLIVDLKGDSILAIWRGGRTDAELRRQACNAALEVAKAVNRFNDSHDRLKLPTRIGVHAGQIFLGNIGSTDHYAYGARGDAVNTASRMDGLNKYIHTKIAVSDEVIKDLQDFFTREAGVFQLKGKNQPVTVHELIGRLEEASEKQKSACARFADALQAFRRKAWREAREKFQCLALSEDDGLAAFYTRLCEQYEEKAPADSWAGTIPIEEK